MLDDADADDAELIKLIRVGTDCSGMDAPIQALLNLGVPFKHEFSCDIDPFCRQTIAANYSPRILYTDITTRSIDDIPDIDLYVCGFPCQPFSRAGKQQGPNDARGTIVEHCIRVIAAKRPTCFILENVPGLVHMRDFFDHIITQLQSIQGYTVHWRLLNTRHYGTPQNRQRVYIVGVQHNIPFQWPAHQPMTNLTTIVDHSNQTPHTLTPRLETHLTRIRPDALFVNLSFIHKGYPNAHLYSPCITAASSLWCVPYHRRATVKEYLKLQGFPEGFKQVVSTAQMKKQIGNSMSVCVLEHLFHQLVPYIKM